MSNNLPCKSNASPDFTAAAAKIFQLLIQESIDTRAEAARHALTEKIVRDILAAFLDAIVQSMWLPDTAHSFPRPDLCVTWRHALSSLDSICARSGQSIADFMFV